ncbi:hypothetical protein TUM19329_08710 [Legionella antarctica]|uniref:FAD-binding domain-containing protein n=1 Tax=Legionella antarctica TaxID=2708020 RepID=A0A6F8T2X3_9GAMM|nr:FAD-dependent monooxygenase [Legionella antarctica]BCA94510.1 hypothetical protein TUM19329_08710 [Legionella antarctica]
MVQNNIDVLIVGGGPVGLFCANELLRHGLSCRIIDKKKTISDKSKALGIHIRTLDVLDDCELIDEFLKQGQQVIGAIFKSRGKTLFHVNLKEIEASRHYLIDLPQNQTETILHQHLQNRGIQVEWETELTHVTQTETEISATVIKSGQSEFIKARWLIACDGAHSTVRHQVDGKFKGSSYQQTWWLADLLVDWTVPEDQMAIFISSKGPLACFPMGNKRYRLVMTAPKDNTLSPSIDDIDRVFKERSSDPAILSNPFWITPFSIHHRQIQQYRYDRIFFAGDAAHIHSPMGGQGLNTGIQDIYNLVWKLALVEKGKAKPELLNSYHEERFAVGQAVLKKTHIMTRMILLTNPLVTRLRNAFIQFITSFKKIRKMVITDIAELDITYANSSIVHQSGSLKHLKVGIFLPDFQLLDQTTQKMEPVNSIIQGTQHHLIIFSGDDSKRVSEVMNLADSLAELYPHTLQTHLVLQSKLETTNKRLRTWLDEQQHVHQHFGITQPSLLLVRPDKYIGILHSPINQKELYNQLYLLPETKPG